MKLMPTVKSFLWIGFVCIIGLIQILIVYAGSYLNGDTMIALSKFYSEGFFLFFSISLISGIIYEFVWEADCRLPSWVNSILIVFCILLLIWGMLTYALAFSAKISSTNSLNKYTYLQQLLTGFSVTISLLMKGLIYHSR
jgi:hypothetical protein